MPRVAVLDDHPAVLAGLQRLLDSTADVQLVASASSARQLSRGPDAMRADVVVLDYDLTDDDALTLCQALKQRVRPPAVVIYSAHAGPRLAIAARIAGADALVDKRAPARELLLAIRRVAAGASAMPSVSADQQETAISRPAPDDVPVASMLLAGTSHQGIAETLATDRREVVGRVRRIVGRLRPTASPAPTADGYCRRCAATFDRPFPQPYGAICPNCLADGDIITLIPPPERTRHRAVTAGSAVSAGGERQAGQGFSDA